MADQIKDIKLEEDKEEKSTTITPTHINFKPYPSSPISNTNFPNLRKFHKRFDFTHFYYDNTYAKKQMMQEQYLVEELPEIHVQKLEPVVVNNENEKLEKQNFNLKKPLDNKILLKDLHSQSYFAYNNLSINLFSKLLRWNFLFDVIYSFGVILFVLSIIFLGLNATSAQYTLFVYYQNTIPCLVTGLVLLVVAGIYFFSVVITFSAKITHFGSKILQSRYNSWLIKQFIPFYNLSSNFTFLAFIYTFENTNSSYTLSTKFNYLQDL